ncbi:MAG: hypothetical protein IKT40_09485 [Bacilli bacterium]|nr:hypothetical protein [Bacilli bacterium]
MNIENKLKVIFDLSWKIAFFVLVAYISICATFGFKIAYENATMIDKIIEMDTIQCKKISQLIDSNNDLVRIVNCLTDINN